MASNRKRSSVDEWTADKWFREFFSQCLLPEEYAERYAVVFAQNGMRSDMLALLDRELLKEMKIDKVGHMIEILRVAQDVSSQEQRSEISHSSKLPAPTVQSKVVSLKSIVSTKDSRQRKESEVGGVKRDVGAIKRPVPDEGPTLSVKMPSRLKLPPSNIQEDDSQNLVRTSIKDRTSAQSVEVSSSTEKKQKKSVFDRLGSVSGADPNSPAGGILKKNTSSSNPPTPVKYGPVEMPKPIAPPEQKRLRSSPQRLVLNNSGVRSSKPTAAQIKQDTVPSRPRSLSPGPSNKKASVEPAFHVTMSMKLSNPLVTKVSNGPLNRKQQERRSFSASVTGFGRSTSAPQISESRQYYGSMAADQVEMSRDIGAEKALKQRLGSRGYSWSKEDCANEKKRVSFGNVRTKEIPAIPGTQPLNPNPAILCKQIYSGSVALRTAKKL